MKFEIRYKGRSGRFQLNQVVTVELKMTKSRGLLSEPLEYYDTGNYRVMPYEFRKFWEYKDVATYRKVVLRSLYYGVDMAAFVYTQNPLLELIKK